MCNKYTDLLVNNAIYSVIGLYINLGNVPQEVAYSSAIKQVSLIHESILVGNIIGYL